MKPRNDFLEADTACVPHMGLMARLKRVASDGFAFHGLRSSV